MDIRTIKYHKRMAAEGKDRALHLKAIRALELGETYGIQGPACMVEMIFDGDTVISKLKLRTAHGMAWKLSDAMKRKYKRGWVPSGLRSIVQKSLGLSEKVVAVPALKTMIRGKVVPL